MTSDVRSQASKASDDNTDAREATHEDGDVLTALFEAAASGELTKMMRLIEFYSPIAHLSARDSQDGDSLLHAAVNGGRRDVVQYLLSCEHGVQIDVRNNNGWTPLMTAIDLGDTRMAKMLIDAGADVDLLWIQDYSCLGCAVALCAQQPETPSRQEMIRLLATRGADIDARHTATGQTALHVAAMFECTDAMAILLEHGADLSVTDANDCTIADFAAANGHLRVLQWLETYGFSHDFERENAEKRTPLTRAVTRGFLDVAQFLVRHQDDRWFRGTDQAHQVKSSTVREYICVYRTQALYWALQSDSYEAAVFLCESGAQASRIGAGVGCKHTTALHIATKFGRLDFAEYLIESQGADVNCRNQRGRTPLHAAVIEGNMAMAKLLLMHGADVDANSQSRIPFTANNAADMKTPLQFAICHGHYDVAALLLQHGASVVAPPVTMAAKEVQQFKYLWTTDADADRDLALLKEHRVVSICA